jgi:hypothetical protein
VHALSRTQNLLCRSQALCHHVTPLEDLLQYYPSFVILLFFLLFILFFVFFSNYWWKIKAHVQPKIRNLYPDYIYISFNNLFIIMWRSLEIIKILINLKHIFTRGLIGTQVQNYILWLRILLLLLFQDNDGQQRSDNCVVYCVYLEMIFNLI